MIGMILAAGRGTRLGSLTEQTPKCLVQAGGKTLIEHAMQRLVNAGVNEIVINLHHLSAVVEKFLDTNPFPEVIIHRSHEPELYETGGGVKAAARWLAYKNNSAPFFVHNADVYTTFQLEQLRLDHANSKASATLLVLEKPSQRGLLVDSNNRVCGWVGKNFKRVIHDASDLRLVNFCGIQICNQEVLDWMHPLGEHFSIIEAYMAGTKAGKTVRIMSLPADQHWFDVGTPERLRTLQDFLGLN